MSAPNDGMEQRGEGGTDALAQRKKRKRFCHFDGVKRGEAEQFRQWLLHTNTYR